MPGYKSHILGGLGLTGGGLALLGHFGLYAAPAPKLAALAAVSAIGAMVPDVDTASKGRHWFYLAILTLDLALLWTGEYRWSAILGLCALLPCVGPHRGWTHTWWAMLALPAPIVAAPWYFLNIPWQDSLPFYLAASAGYFSHLFLDRKFG